MSLWDKLDQAEVAAKKSFDLLPENTYVAVVSNITIKEDDFPEKVTFDVEYTIKSPDEYTGRKVWFSASIDDETSGKKLNFIKSQVCAMAGVDSTNGNPMAVLSECKGNEVELEIKHRPGIKNPEKIYVNAYVQNRLS